MRLSYTLTELSEHAMASSYGINGLIASQSIDIPTSSSGTQHASVVHPD